MKAFFLAFAVCLCLTACNPQTPAKDPKAIAADALTGLTMAWDFSAEACLSVERSCKLAKGTCAADLLPVRDSLLAAASSLDTWDDAAQRNFPCLIADAAKGLEGVETVMREAGVSVPPQIDIALNLGLTFVPSCVPTDAGAE